MKKTTKNTFKFALKMWGRIVFASIMCAVLYFSLHMLVSMVFSQEVGYRIYETSESGTPVEIESHYYTADEDSTMSVPLLEGQTKQPIKELTDGAAATFNVLVQLLMLGVLAVFPYDRMWNLGARDENMVQCGRKKANNLRGFIIGLLASVPSAILFVLLIMTRFGILPAWFMTIYRVCNICYLPFINLFFTADVMVTDAGVVPFIAAAVTLFFVPAICALGYRLGRSGFSLRDHLVYKQKKSK